MVNLLEMLEYSRQIVIQAKDIAGRQNGEAFFLVNVFISTIILIDNIYLFFSTIAEVDLIKLPEDTTLSGFTPLMSNPQDPCYADKSEDMVGFFFSLYIPSLYSYRRLLRGTNRR